MSDMAGDLGRHMSQQMQETMMRHLEVARSVLRGEDIIMMMLVSGVDVCCSAIATAVATIAAADPASDQNALALDMAGHFNQLLASQLDFIVEKARAAVAERAAA